MGTGTLPQFRLLPLMQVAPGGTVTGSIFMGPGSTPSPALADMADVGQSPRAMQVIGMGGEDVMDAEVAQHLERLVATPIDKYTFYRR